MKTILFIGVLLLATFLRFFMLSSVPPSPSLDEATIGWNAYSILHTGKDEYGYFLPILLRAYDDYRPALYVYLVIPFVKLFGLKVFAVRLPSVILSLLIVVMTYFLTSNIFNRLKEKRSIGLFAMFLFAISPISVYVSRLGHEVNLGLAVVVASLLSFFLFLNKKNGWFLVASLFLYGASFYTYQSEKIFTPLMLLILGVLFYRRLLAVKKYFVLGIILFAFVSLPIVMVSFSPGSLLRLKGTSIFINNPAFDVSAKKVLIAKQHHDSIGQLFNNRRLVTVEIFLQNYSLHLNPSWLLANSGNEPFKAPNTGLMYLWEFPFLLTGIILLLQKKEIEKKVKALLFLWIAVSFVAPGLTTDSPHAMRALTLLPSLQILTAFGFFGILGFLQKQSKGISLGFSLLMSVIAFQSLIQFGNNYFISFPLTQSQSFQYPMQNTVFYINQEKNNYEKIFVSNKNALYQSYMFYLFYSAYDPKKYFAMGGTKSGGFNESHIIDTIYFGPLSYTKKDSNLYIGNPGEFPLGIDKLSEFRYLDGSTGIVAVK